MSILDDDFYDKTNAQLDCYAYSYNLFLNVFEPLVKELANSRSINDFAYGVSSQPHFANLKDILSKLCGDNNILLFNLDCSQDYILPSLTDYVATITTRPYTVILLENFDKISDKLPFEKSYIENYLIHSWEQDFMTYRNRFLVVFLTSENYGDQPPIILKNINPLRWYGANCVEK